MTTAAPAGPARAITVPVRASLAEAEPVSEAVPVANAEPVDVCLLVEGTYPYVPGGVSAWVHDILDGHRGMTFSIFNIGSHPGAYGSPCYELPPHVRQLHQVYCHDAVAAAPTGAARARLDREIRDLRLREPSQAPPSRVLRALRRLNLDTLVDDQLLDDLTSGDLTTAEFLHGRQTFELLEELAPILAPEASFLDLFWHFRAIHLPVLNMLATTAPPARCYHAVSTGYAGLCGAAFSLKTGRPLLVTEHGIYARERDMDLARAEWIKDQPDGGGIRVGARPSPLRGLWSRSFRALSALAYHQATRITTLSEANRARQIAAGAPPSKISIIANGVDVPEPAGDGSDAQLWRGSHERPPMRVGFVGRVVPIKDVITFIRACALALAQVPLDVRIIGPCAEDSDYVRRCKELVDTLGVGSAIKFVGPMPPAIIYKDLDVVVLTSFSEGQPLVMLEAYAAGLPVIATDVGACREMIEGRSEPDRQLGPSGLVTRVGIPTETADALVRMAGDAAWRHRLGAAGRQRVLGYYRRKDMLQSYGDLYRTLVTP